MPEWTIQHRSMEGGIYYATKPAREFTIQRNRNAPSSISYQLAISDPNVTRDSVVPYETYFHLFRDSVRVMSGPVTQVEWDSEDDGVISIAGQTWLHLLEKRMAPVNLDDRKTWFSYQGPLTGCIEQAIDLINNYDAELAGTDDLYGVNPGVRWIVDSEPAYIDTLVSEQLAALDGQNLYDFIKRVAENDEGCDFEGFWFGADAGGPGPTGEIARLVLYHPNRQISVGRGVIHTFSHTRFSELISIRWRNSGPHTTRGYYIGTTLGKTVGAKLEANKDVAIRTEVANGVNKYGLLEEQIDLTTYVDEQAVGSAADSQFRIDKHEKHELEIVFDTQVLNRNFWTSADPGDLFKVDWDFGFHRINETYVMNGYSATITENGDEIITPELERYRPT